MSISPALKDTLSAMFRCFRTNNYSIWINKGFFSRELLNYSRQLTQIPENTTRGKALRKQIDTTPFIIKEYLHGGLISFLGNKFYCSNPLLNETEKIFYLKERGINVPEVAALIMVKKFLYRNYYLITKEIEGARTVKLRDISTRKKLGEISTQVKKMHNSMICHGDLNLTNILSNKTQYYITDMVNSRYTNNPSCFKKDIYRLMRSAEKTIRKNNRIKEEHIMRTLYNILKSYYGEAATMRRLYIGYQFHIATHRFWWKLLEIFKPVYNSSHK